MVAFRYFGIDPHFKALLEAFDDLMRLFQHLLLNFSGDVDAALEYMKRLQQMGYIDKAVDLARFRDRLEQGKLIQPTPEGRATLTNLGERFIRRSALEEVFGSLKKGRFGEHRTAQAGDGGERLPEVHDYRFGDDLELLDLNGSVHNSLVRAAGEGFELQERDLVVHEVEHHTTCATVLLIDISHSMILYGEDRITPAKKVALALAELIRTKYPKDSLHVAVFGDEAVEIPIHKIARIDAGPYHTNTKAALRLARQILMRKKHPNKQIVMITDGKPSAVFEEGRLYVNPFGLDPRIVAQTLDEAAVLRRYRIVVTTFMLTDHPQLVDFVEKLTRINRGRAYFTNCRDVGKALFVDYLKNRRKKYEL
ncbi:MAG TPA: VWA domain-containing protein [Planctomycetota bacterium]|nr:VWA domain-containing protein [Planctomycetota bacterium]